MFTDYELADLLAYDLSIWLALIRQYLLDWWPLLLIWPAGLILALWASAGRANSSPTGAGWPVLVWLALAWCWVAWAFHLQQHLTLNWAAGYWASAWFVQSALLLLVALLATRSAGSAGVADQPVRRGPALTVAGLSLILPPALGWMLDGVTPGQGEVFGMTPDATAFTTLAVVSGLRGRRAVGSMLLLAVIPVAALTVSALFGRALGLVSPTVLAVLGAALAVSGPMLAARRASDRASR